MEEVTVTKKVYLSKNSLDQALDFALQAEAIQIVENIRNNMDSMGIKDSGREIDSVQAKMKGWETPMGGKAQSDDAIKIPDKSHEINIGSGVPYAGVNEFGGTNRPPRPAIRNGSKIDDKIFLNAYNAELARRTIK